MDNIGASEDMRKCYMETYITYEIIFSYKISKVSKISCYIFGSRTEGTTTSGLKSDVDFLVCFEPIEVVQFISDIPLQCDRDYMLIVRERNTKPGYCKLQLVHLRTPITRSDVLEQLPDDFQFDCNDRVIRTAGLLHKAPQPFSMYESHGPAIAGPATLYTYANDFVGAYRCRSWPNAASEWLYRARKYGWPSQGLIEKLKKLGFFVVKVGHPHSSEQNYEWRISLSLQERLLMFSLNSTQFKCYILLKMVKKDYINKKLGVEAISSYHCKTCLFYVIENTPGDFWQPSNLMACLWCCLNCIYRWVKTGNCPNYFIPSENMFEGRMDDDLRIKLEMCCCVLVTADCGFLLSIQCDDLAKRMENSVFPGTVAVDTDALAKERMGLYINLVSIAAMDEKFLDARKSTTIETIRDIFRYMSTLTHAIPITEHTSDQIRNAATIALPYLEISLVSYLIVNKVELGEVDTAVDLLLSSKWQELSNRSDCFSAKLKQATFLYMMGQYEACQEVLVVFENNWPLHQITFCDCRNQTRTYPPKHLPSVEEKIISFDEFKTSYYAPCIKFSWLEKKLIPTVLTYEMLKSVHMPSPSVGNNDTIVEPDWIMIDSKIFLWFLIFLLGKAKDRQATGIAIKKMEHILKTDPNLKHTETAMNLIGWCYKQEGNVGKAVGYFYLSLALMKSHNAAFWHILFTVCEMISSKKLTKR